MMKQEKNNPMVRILLITFVMLFLSAGCLTQNPSLKPTLTNQPAIPSPTPQAAPPLAASPTPPPTQQSSPEGLTIPSTGTGDPANWAQVQSDPQHSGFVPVVLGTNFPIRWTHAFQPEKVYPQVQAIVANGRVFVGTENGNLYAFQASNGAQIWKFSPGAPILNSVGVAGDVVIFGCMDGAVYGVNATNGQQIWRQALSGRLGFSTAPVIANSLAMLGGRNGVFYALDVSSGALRWQYDAGAPILQTAAWDNNRVFFGTMAMFFYALDTNNGALLWKSLRLPGIALKDYWPVVLNNLIYVRPTGMGGLGVANWADAINAQAQNAVLNDYAAHPGSYTLNLIRINTSNGTFAPPVIQYDFQTMNGATSPPCVTKDGGMIVPAPAPSGYKTGWARLDPVSRILTRLLREGSSEKGFGNMDENMNLTCVDNGVLVMHTEEMNAQFTGFFNLSTSLWTQIAPGHINNQMSTNTQGGGGNPATIVTGSIYHISFYELIARDIR